MPGRKTPVCLRDRRRRGSETSDCWFTPRSLIDALGRFDLDPANSHPRSFPTAKRHFGPRQNGLAQPWRGRVWLNPPFSNARPWIERLIEHGDGVALVFVRSDAAWRAVRAASAFVMLRGRTQFQRPGGGESRCPLGCALLAFGRRNARAVREANLDGMELRLAA